jgi:hypothetical protein
LVFFTNMPTNSGMTQVSYILSGSSEAERALLEKFAGGMETTIEGMISKLGIDTTVRPEDGRVGSSVAAVDPDFRMPQVWKTALAVDYSVPVDFPFTVTAEAMYTKNVNAVRLDNYAIRTSESGGWDRFSGSDNRLIYPHHITINDRGQEVINRDFYYNSLREAAVLTNTDKGYGYTLNLTVRTRPVKDLDIMAAYTHTEMKEVSGMPGSNAGSAWQGLYTVNGPNLATVQRSQYVIPDQVIGSVSYTLPDVSWKSSTLSLFYRGYSPGGYSFTYNGDMNFDGISNNDLMYIPRGKGDIKFSSPDDETAFLAFVEQDRYLRKHKGQYAEAYAARAPWVHRFDLRFLQDFKIKSGNQMNVLQLSLDVLNVGNMINSKWGVAKNMSNANSGRVLQFNGVDAGNVPEYSFRKVNGAYPTQTWSQNLNYSECWSLQIGIRYLFN